MHYNTKDCLKNVFLLQYYSFFNFQMDSFNELIEGSDSLIRKIKKKQILKYKNKLEDEYYLSEFYDARAKLFRINDIHINSVFLSLFSFAENCFKKLTEIIQEKTHLPNTIKKCRGDGDLDVYIAYLTGNPLLRDENWKEIRKYRIVRIAIAHYNSIAYNADVINIVRQDNNISYDPNTKEFAIKSKKYLLNFISLVSNYVRYICYEQDKNCFIK